MKSFLLLSLLLLLSLSLLVLISVSDAAQISVDKLMEESHKMGKEGSMIVGPDGNIIRLGFVHISLSSLSLSLYISTLEGTNLSDCENEKYSFQPTLSTCHQFFR